MSEEPKDEPKEGLKTGSTTIVAAVAERIIASNPVVIESVVAALAQKTIDARVMQITTALTELDTKQKELKKLKPDNVIYDAARKVISEGYNKATLDSRDTLQKRIDKIESAIREALDNNNWDPLSKLGAKE